MRGARVVELPRICPPARQIFLLDFNADFSTFLYQFHVEILQHTGGSPPYPPRERTISISIFKSFDRVMTQKLKSLNHIPEFATDAGIAGVINYINTGNFPAGLNNRQQQRYAQKFNGFVVHAGVLRYNPNPSINLPVCPNKHRFKMSTIILVEV